MNLELFQSLAEQPVGKRRHRSELRHISQVLADAGYPMGGHESAARVLSSLRREKHLQPPSRGGASPSLPSSGGAPRGTPQEAKMGKEFG